MPETIKRTPGVGLIIKYNGVFDFDKLYKGMHDWFVMHRYDFQEKEQTRKGKDLGAFMELEWAGERRVDEYAKFSITVHFIIEEMERVENLDKGKLLIELAASLILDYKNSWQSNSFKKFLFNIYNKYIIKEKIKKYYFGKLYAEVTDLQDTGKSILDLYG